MFEAGHLNSSGDINLPEFIEGIQKISLGIVLIFSFRHFFACLKGFDILVQMNKDTSSYLNKLNANLKTFTGRHPSDPLYLSCGLEGQRYLLQVYFYLQGTVFGNKLPYGESQATFADIL